MKRIKWKNKRASLAGASAFLVVVVAIGAWVSLRTKPKVQYVTATAELRDIEQSVLAVGTIRAADTVSVGAQASGQIKFMKVKLGDQVSKGQLIAEIDSLPQNNALQTAQAQLSGIQAQRNAAIATLRQSDVTRKRNEEMLVHDASTRQEVDVANASYEVALANVKALDEQIKSATISVDTARVTLGYWICPRTSGHGITPRLMIPLCA